MSKARRYRQAGRRWLLERGGSKQELSDPKLCFDLGKIVIEGLNPEQMARLRDEAALTKTKRNIDRD